MSATSAKMSDGAQAQPLRVLVVDDSRPALAALRACVERQHNFIVADTAADGCEALERARACHPDVVIIDFDMPRLNGIDATKTLIAEFPRLAVVLVSLHDTSELRCRSLEVGARAFVPKQDLAQNLPAVLNGISRTLAK